MKDISIQVVLTLVGIALLHAATTPRASVYTPIFGHGIHGAWCKQSNPNGFTLYSPHFNPAHPYWYNAPKSAVLYWLPK